MQISPRDSHLGRKFRKKHPDFDRLDAFMGQRIGSNAPPELTKETAATIIARRLAGGRRKESIDDADNLLEVNPPENAATHRLDDDDDPEGSVDGTGSEDQRELHDMGGEESFDEEDTIAKTQKGMAPMDVEYDVATPRPKAKKKTFGKTPTKSNPRKRCVSANLDGSDSDDDDTDLGGNSKGSKKRGARFSPQKYLQENRLGKRSASESSRVKQGG
ncbi:hypothetical protein BJ742DRAFT_852065 [Cladochytrium replicatum]|nr:hypothetical protein BJ742DRAFT_852065 [Cladochytrium replicatum]